MGALGAGKEGKERLMSCCGGFPHPVTIVLVG